MVTATAADHAPPLLRPVESRDPATGEVWRTYAPAGQEAVERAVAAARLAQHAWAMQPLRERERAIGRIAEALYRRRAEVAALIQRETGKPAAEAMVTEILVTLDLARYFRTASGVLFGARERWFTPSNIALWRKRVRIAHEPYGVLGVIAPWNYPFMLPAGAVLAGLITGNAVVVKPSEYTPGTGLLIADLCHEAGLPADLIAVLPGGGATGAALIASGVDKVFFTGSAATGRTVAVACAERMVPCVLELGGSDPAIVLEDADVPTTVSGILWGRFSNAGQTCVAPKRVLVVGDIHDRVLDGIAAAVRGLRVSAPTEPACDVGPLIRPWQARHLEEQLDDALARGARVVARANAPLGAPGYFAPTVLADVTPAMRVMREESFGPLLPIVRVRDVEDAVAVANDSAFGLSASVWSRDVPRAIRVAARIDAGSVTINDALVAVGIAEAPHGGVKGSGTGRTHGLEGLLECVHTKTLIADRWTRVRPPWWFGYGEEHARNVDAFVRLWHGTGLRDRLGGVWRSMKMLVVKERPL